LGHFIIKNPFKNYKGKDYRELKMLQKGGFLDPGFKN
jgi:hypothetical protein